MKKIILNSLLAVLLLFGYETNSSALDVATHEAINAHIAQNLLSGFYLGTYLHDELGFDNHEKEKFNSLLEK